MLFRLAFVAVGEALSRPRAVRGRGARLVSMAAETHFDYLVIGGGSGGIASAKRAASYGKKVAVIERQALGGTCVNVGCVPKKVMWNAAHVMEVAHESHLYSYAGGDKMTFDWKGLKTARDNYVTRLNGIYSRGLDSAGVSLIEGLASFDSPTEVRVGDAVYTADHIMIATGGVPTFPEIPGKEHIISSDGFFELEALPASCAVIGAGYIAVEMAGILCALGSETSLLVRGDKALRAFDDLVADHLDFEMKRQGMVVVPKTTLASVTLDETTGLKTLTTTDGRTLGPFECVLAAVGRSPLTAPLALEKAGVSTKANGYISVDEYQATSAAQVYALGDVCGDVELTPMAIAAGRRLADRLFGDAPQSKADYSNVPTVVFSHPTIGTIGLTEAEAKAQFGDEAVTIYTTTFVNLWYGPMPIEPSTKPKSKMKLVCTGPEETVVGLHCIGMASDELLQGFGVAMKMKATKADFDSCIALHPTAAEEVVTMAPWGLSGSDTRGA